MQVSSHGNVKSNHHVISHRQLRPHHQKTQPTSAGVKRAVRWQQPILPRIRKSRIRIPFFPRKALAPLYHPVTQYCTNAQETSTVVQRMSTAQPHSNSSLLSSRDTTVLRRTTRTCRFLSHTLHLHSHRRAFLAPITALKWTDRKS